MISIYSVSIPLVDLVPFRLGFLSRLVSAECLRAIRIVTESCGKSPTLGQISGGIGMEFPPMSAGIPRISPPWMGRGGRTYTSVIYSY